METRIWICPRFNPSRNSQLCEFIYFPNYGIHLAVHHFPLVTRSGVGHIYRVPLATTLVISVTSPWFTLPCFRRDLFTAFRGQHFLYNTRVSVSWFSFARAHVDPPWSTTVPWEHTIPCRRVPGPRATTNVGSSCVHQYDGCQAPRPPTTTGRQMCSMMCPPLVWHRLSPMDLENA